MPKKPVIMIAVIGIILLVGGLYLNNIKSNKSEDLIIASGTIEATEVDIAAEVPGVLKEVKIEEGQKVKFGDLLAKIDSTNYDLKVKQSEAVLQSIMAKAGEIKSGNRKEMIETAKANVEQVQALIKGAETSKENAEENYERIKALFEKGATTEQQLEQAQNRIQLAKSEYNSLNSRLKSANEQLKLLIKGATSQAIDMVNAEVLQAQVGLDIAQNQQNKTIITCPVDGIVNSVNFRKGEFINTGVSIATIMDPGDLWIKVYIPETQIPRIKLGQLVQISIDAFPAKTFKGEVSYISDKAEFTPKNVQTKEERVKTVFAVKIKVKEGFDKLKPGLPADVEIKI